MAWTRHYRIVRYIQNSLWVPPTGGIIAAMILVRIVYRIDERMGWLDAFSPDTAREVLGTLAASLFTFIVFLSSALLLAVQLASGQLTPLIIGLLFKDPLTKLALTLFSFAFTFTLGALVRVTLAGPRLTCWFAAYTSMASVIVFLCLIDHVGKLLRPSGILRIVGKAGREVIEAVYPHRLGDPQTTAIDANPLAQAADTRTIANPRDGVIVAVDVESLLRLAVRSDCRIELVPQIGSYAGAEEPLFRVFGGRNSVPNRALYRSVLFGQDRELEQDPTFAFRIVVDIAIKALSPGINDPTTAVVALDQIQYMLRVAGGRRLDDGRVCDESGQVRLMLRRPTWDDLVRLAVTEIRQYGSQSIQIARRLRAMLEHLIETLPSVRRDVLVRELQILQSTGDRSFAESADQAQARLADPQGMGGHAANANGDLAPRDRRIAPTAADHHLRSENPA